MFSDMKKVISLIVTSLISVCTWSQTPEAALSSYQKFKTLSASGAAEADLYGAVYQCYLDNIAVIRTYDTSSPQYDPARNAVVDIWPFLRNAATYYDQKGNRKNALVFSRAYVDIPLEKNLQKENFVKDQFYPTIVFYAASNTFNTKDYTSAIKYFKEYLSTGDQQHIYNVKKYMAVACANIKDYEQAKRILDEALMMNPSDGDLISLAINVCIESKDNSQLQKYLSKALARKPNDQNLLNLQGKLYEENCNYVDALKIYTSLFSKNPKSLTYAKHIALNNYNLGVLYTNKSSLETDKRISQQYDNQALVYFETAIPILKEILNSDPGLLQYREALAVAYKITGRTSELATENQTISNLGGSTLNQNYIPSIMTYDAPKQETTPSVTDISSQEIPLYSYYAKKFIEETISKWQEKDPYETIEEYKARVTARTRDQKIKELLNQAEARYIELYARDVKITDMRLCPYDAEHEVFLAESDFGDVFIPVPRANNEARIFESGWNGTRCMNPRYAIDNDKIVLRGLTFVTPMGKSYRFEDSGNREYVQTEVDIHFDDIDYSSLGESRYEKPKQQNKKVKVTVGVADVDKNIPESKSVNEKTFAVIIANENYEMVTGVPMALNDGRTFGLYCEKTLGLPKNNIRIYENATYGTMLHAMSDISSIASAYNGDINVIFYYAGHGFPDENSKNAYLLPVDGDGMHIAASYSLEKLYSELGGLAVKSVVVFLDACFSGSNRDGSMLVSARGFALKPKAVLPQGNMVVLSAASADETAFPYEEKGHGMFTYFLLKKLQTSKGNATLGEISEYVIENVRQQSVVINRKSQTPQVSPSTSWSDSWKNIKLK